MFAAKIVIAPIRWKLARDQAKGRGRTRCGWLPSIYSDPKDDGYYQGDVYPIGPYRNENGVQRGSVTAICRFSPGDPLTPGWAAQQRTPDVIRREEAKTIMKIPVLPISHGDALPLLKALEGRGTCQETGAEALPITYHYGQTGICRRSMKVRLKVISDWNI
jgi:N-acetylated-alpha-linked acidic dipeptidase